MINLTIPGPPVGKQRAYVWPISVLSEDILLAISCDGEPIAHQRPRKSRAGHFYTPDKTREYRNLLAGAILNQLSGITSVRDKELTFGVQAKFYRSNRQKIDVDNLLKSVLDSITQSGFWLDDSQAHEIYGSVEKASANPRVDFIVYRYHLRGDEAHGGKYDLPKSCANCGKDIPKMKTFPSSTRKYCSQECSNASRRITMKCAECGKDFELPKSFAKGNVLANGKKYPRRFCSRDCSIAYHRRLQRIKGKESEKWICTKGGGRVSRKEYTQCFGCFIKSRSDPISNYWKLRHQPKHYADDKPMVEVIMGAL